MDELLVIPFFIANKEITKERLPKEIGLQKRGNGTVDVNGRKINVTMGTPIGTVPGIVDVLIKRIITNGGEKDTPIMIIGHGSNSPGSRRRSRPRSNLSEKGLCQRQSSL